MPMRIAIRTDATSEIGTGHFVRCLTLANALARRGAQIRFVSRGLPEHLQVAARAAGHEVAALNAEAALVGGGGLAHSHWLGATQQQDATQTLAALGDAAWDWVTVDHYALDERWESAVRPIAARVLVIDDLADRSHACDLLLDQNLYPGMERRYAGRVPAGCEQLMGPRFALLREEFAAARAQARPRDGSLRRLLVFMGGADAGNYTGRVLEVLSRASLPGVAIDIVIGAQHPAREQIAATCAARGYTCHVQTPHLAGMMAAADAAVGASGSASWERCSVGLPAVVVAVAGNQRPIAAALAEAGAVLLANDRPGPLELEISAALGLMRDNPGKMKALSQAAAVLVDGGGAGRVVDRMFSLS